MNHPTLVDAYLPPFLTVSITDINSQIATAQKLLSLHHRSHPEYIISVQYLAIARSGRYQLSNQKEDLDKSILHYTEAILLLPISQSGPLLHAAEGLFRLALALLIRFERFQQPGDIEYATATEYLRYIRRFSLYSFYVPRKLVTTWLTRALQAQIKAQITLGVGNWTQDIKEMVVLCNELLSSKNSEDVPTTAFMCLHAAVVTVESNHRLPTEVLDEQIECLRDAVKVCRPASHEVMYSLAYALGNRFLTKHSREDYEEATALLERVLEPGGCPDSYREMPSLVAIVLTCVRSDFLKEPECAEVAISRLRAALRGGFNYPFLDEKLRRAFTSSLAHRNGIRFREYGLEESRDEANVYVSQLVNASSSSGLAESAQFLPMLEEARETHSVTDLQQYIEHLKNMLSITPPGTKRYIKCTYHLETWYESKFYRTNDLSDLEEAIKYGHLSLDATCVGDQWRINCLYSLRDLLLLAFAKTRKINYLDESIALGYDILGLEIAHQIRFHATQSLVSSLCIREQLLGQTEDRHEAIRLISSVINDQYVQAPGRFKLSCEWAILARSIGHSTTLAAYKTAMSLIQKSFSLAPTVSVQHARLVAMGENCQTMPLDYASYQIHLGQFEEAVETLEQGRALLWSEMRGLRTPAIQVIEEDSPLAKRFAEINEELETLTIAATPSGRPEVEDGIHEGADGTDPFGRLVLKRKKLVEERDALTSQIQSRPGSEGFLGTSSFDTLRSAASRGPVIIINHCEWRSDIIIIFHNSLPCSLPTSSTFYVDANKLHDELVKARASEGGLNSKEYQDALCSVLKGLYKLVGQPVIKRLRLLGVPEQSRIWWCPTSVFCLLPLHAMGPIPSSESEEPRYFSDLYIPSYTPTLSALIDSRRASPRIREKPSLLLVAQPDHDLPGVRGEIKVIRKLGELMQTNGKKKPREQVPVAELVSKNATPTSVLEGLRGNPLAHFACHGMLEKGKPFEASFKLHGGSYLTLLNIVQSRLPDAEFAFLSCCHAAEITAESVSDEALHLTAAMQYCGFRSVVGTMWAMADTDGRDLAKYFYDSLFSSQDSSVPYYERSAEALRDATQRLREKRGITLERWVNFVHYGA